MALIEPWHGATFHQLMLRAAIAGAIVAVPLPWLGTATAVLFLSWSAVAHTQVPRAH